MKQGVLIAVSALIIVSLGIGGVFWFQATQQPAINPSNIEISEKEQRVFKTLVLKNGLRTVLVSDPDSDKAAAALNVFTGSWANPADVQGMAHFLEHMLFLGTEKFPEVDGYQTFIEQNGGSDNAYTASENTLYYFDINSPQLAPALDRFSQFFIAPLFDPDFSDRERNAVHSEYSASLQNDGRRIEDVVREISDANHPASLLAVGNLLTLNDPNMSNRLNDFFREHYVASNMSLAIYGSQDIATLEAWAKQYFEGVREIDHTEVVYEQPMFSASQLPLLVEIEPRRELRRLDIRFPMPGNALLLANKPHQFVGHLLGHESEGSLFSVLKNKGWAESLSAGSGDLTKSNTTFDVGIQLTPDGLENWQAVVGLLFSHIELIKTQGIQEWVFTEKQNINRISFEFAEKVSASSTTVRLAERLRHYSPQEILSGPYKLELFDKTEVEQILNLLKPDNALVLLIHPDAKTDQESEFYNTPYSAKTLSGNLVAEWRTPSIDPALALPEPNPFVPTEFEVALLEREESILYKYAPQIIAQSDTRTVWFEQDDEFKTPKTDIHILLESNMSHQSANDAMALALYLELVNDSLSDVRYQAGLAGSGYGIGLTDKGIQIRLYGYQNKLPLLLDTLVLELADHAIKSERFAIKREELLRRLRNRSEDPVVNQVIRRLNDWMISNTFEVAAQIDAVESLSSEKLIAARTEFMQSAKLNLLIHGNLVTNEALQLAERIDAVIPQEGKDSVNRMIAQLPAKKFITEMDIDHSDAAFLQLYQGNNSTLRERALYALLAEAMSAPYFAELRTKEQLGYIVLARAYPMDGLPGLILYVQSPSTDPALVQLYSDRFLSRYAQTLSEMNEPTFEAYKQGLITTLTQPDKNLYELSNRYWNNILTGNEHFNTRTRIANEVKKISLDGFRRFFENRILSDDTKSFTIHQVGNDMNEDYNEHRVNIVGFLPIEEPKNWPDDVNWITPTFNNIAN